MLTTTHKLNLLKQSLTLLHNHDVYIKEGYKYNNWITYIDNLLTRKLIFSEYSKDACNNMYHLIKRRGIHISKDFIVSYVPNVSSVNII